MKAPNIVTKVTLVCKECGHTARRRLILDSGCRGVQETRCEVAMCPKGHGPLLRKDGHPSLKNNDGFR